MRLRYHLLDVFTDRLFGGNPLAVCTHGQGLSPELMQAMARELNLSETTFVMPPADPRNHYRVRIFTPGKELPMAGHPTIGTAFVLAAERMIERHCDEALVNLEEGVGTIPVKIRYKEGRPVWAQMQQPLPVFGPVFDDKATLAEMLSLDAAAIDDALPLEMISCGVPFLMVPLRSLAQIRAIRFRLDVWDRTAKSFGAPQVFVFTHEVERPGSAVHARMFGPGVGVFEDPATGSACGPMGCYLVQHGLAKAGEQLQIEQGFEMGRPSFIEVIAEQTGGQFSAVKVGGQACFVGEGYLVCPDL